MAGTASLALLAALILGFHSIPVPDDVTAQSTFSLQGYISESDHTLTDAPGFDPETDTQRPSARVSFLPPATGICVIAETETIDGKTQYAITGRLRAVKGERVYRRAVLLTADDLRGDDWQAAVKERYRIVAACLQGDALLWSSFYEAPVPPPSVKI
jgi:hypothetical protein